MMIIINVLKLYDYGMIQCVTRNTTTDNEDYKLSWYYKYVISNGIKYYNVCYKDVVKVLQRLFS